jgi:trans-AT polyketide synthase, acyltransferase and oxidoreductase domains
MPAMAETRGVPLEGAAHAPTSTSGNLLTVTPEAFGSAAFRRHYGLKYAYLSGAMYKGIASSKLVIAMGKAGLMGYLGTGGLALDAIAAALAEVRAALTQGESYGLNLLSNPLDPPFEMQTVALYLEQGVKFIEASAYTQVSLPLLRLRVSGLKRAASGDVVSPRRILAKISRPEVAEAFMKPAPANLLQSLLARGYVTEDEAALAAEIPVADDLCVEADSGGHTDSGNAYVLMPAISILRKRIADAHRYRHPIHIGLAGGIGTPDSAVAAFMLGADFVTTGSINQCTVEAATSDAVKDILQDLNVQDTDYAPAGDMFEIGARVQVVKRGLFFATRANKLYETYLRYDSLDDIEPALRKQIQDKYFKRSFEEVWEETERYYRTRAPHALDQILGHPKKKMAAVFRWYFIHSARVARRGAPEDRMDYQIHCGPALGAFNQWVKGGALENWRNRHVAEIGAMIMNEAARVLQARLAGFAAVADAPSRVSARGQG